MNFIEALPVWVSSFSIGDIQDCHVVGGWRGINCSGHNIEARGHNSRSKIKVCTESKDADNHEYQSFDLSRVGKRRRGEMGG
jgi:hypothetical protein